MDAQNKAELEQHVKSLIQIGENMLADYIRDARKNLERGASDALRNLGDSVQSQVNRLEMRPLVPGIALFVSGVIIGGLVFRPFRRGALRQAGAPGLRAVSPANASAASSAPSGSTG